MSTINLKTNKLVEVPSTQDAALVSKVMAEVGLNKLYSDLSKSKTSTRAMNHYKVASLRYKSQLATDIINAAPFISSQLVTNYPFITPKLVAAIIEGNMTMESSLFDYSIAGLTTTKDTIALVAANPTAYFDSKDYVKSAKGLLQFMPKTYANTVKNFFRQGRFKKWREYLLSQTLKPLIYVRDPDLYNVISEVGHPTVPSALLLYSQYYPSVHLVYETMVTLLSQWHYDASQGWLPKSRSADKVLTYIWSAMPSARFDQVNGFIYLFTLYHRDGNPLAAGFTLHDPFVNYMMRQSIVYNLYKF